jgi:hypothetical protein
LQTVRKLPALTALRTRAVLTARFGFFRCDRVYVDPVAACAGSVGESRAVTAVTPRSATVIGPTPENVERSAQVVGERGQAELSADIVEAAHQERTLIHPLFDAAEGALDDLAATVENLGPPFETFGHAIERVLVFEARDRPNVVRASRAQWTNAQTFGAP